MRYPTLTPDEVERLVTELTGGDPASVDTNRAVKWLGDGPDFDTEAFKVRIRELREKFDSLVAEHGDSDKDIIEGKLAAELHSALCETPIEVLDDPGFWRYIGIAHLWWLTYWRESKTFDGGDYSRIRVYVDGKRNSECVPVRMFIRGRIAFEAGDPALSWAVSSATDLWRSHIVRVRTSYAPDLAGALLERQASPNSKMPTAELRSAARRLNRLASNTVLVGYDRDACRAVIAGL